MARKKTEKPAEETTKAWEGASRDPRTPSQRAAADARKAARVKRESEGVEPRVYVPSPESEKFQENYKLGPRSPADDVRFARVEADMRAAEAERIAREQAVMAEDPLADLSPSQFTRLLDRAVRSERAPSSYARAGGVMPIEASAPSEIVDERTITPRPPSSRRTTQRSVLSPQVEALVQERLAPPRVPASVRVPVQAPVQVQVPAQAPMQFPVKTYRAARDECGAAAIRGALLRHPDNKTAAARELGLTAEGLRLAMIRAGWTAPPGVSRIRALAGAQGARVRWTRARANG